MYGTLSEFRAYHTARGNTEPTDKADEEANAALTRAADYIQVHYVARFRDGDESRPEVEQATYIAAWYELDKPGFFSKTFTPADQKVLTETDGIKWTPIGNASGVEAATPRSTMIDALLAPFLNMAGGPFVV